VTNGRAAWIAAGVAALVYLPSLGNGFALDDGTIVQRNPAAHSIRTAVAAFDSSYWPPRNDAGQWRPLVILSFAADWQASGGSTAWLHASNVAWHAAATGLLVLVLGPYVSAGAAVAGGVLFAVHPVHVEAVANLVGRAEMMAACFLFLALLLARKVRARLAERRRTWHAELALAAAVVAALLSKEHAALAVALLALDDIALAGEGRCHLPWRDYAAVLVLTVGWFLIRRPIDAGASFATVAPTFFGLGAAGRLDTMLPVVFVLLRLLAWPFDLFPDYGPQVIPRLEHFTALGAAGLVLLLACGALALAAWRRHRALSVGLCLIGIAWLPTSNLFFPTGVVIAERTLYLASAGAALCAAAGFDWLVGRRGMRRAAAATLVIALAFGARTVTQIPVWHGNRELLLWALREHPESYREHLAAARALIRLGDLPSALGEYDYAVELYPLDPYALAEAAGASVDAGRLARARDFLARAEAREVGMPAAQRLVAAVRRMADAAMASGAGRRDGTAGTRAR
jgi:protein O-mannosyl-transferase